MDKTSLGDRMKAYEAIPKNFLMRRTPVIIRIDGKAFHTFTRGFEKPFDSIIQTCMEETMKYCCENIQGCVLGFTQSDEISLILCDYQRLETDAWFGYNVQKVVSISAALATFAFNHVLGGNIIADLFNENGDTFNEKTEFLLGKMDHGAIFDSRCFSLSKEEVCNYMIWRQRDATRNSILGLAQTLYSQKQMEGINTKKLQDKMFTEKGVNWNDLTVYQKQGSCCIKVEDKWVIDDNIPIFSQDRDYINSRIEFPDEEIPSKE